MITRAEWGAKYGKGALDPGAEPRVVIHHSFKPALDPEDDELTERNAVRSIERYHVESNGWDGIGYNFLVAPSGRVYEGRGWLNKGSHAGPVNGSSIGICLLIDGNVTGPGPKLINAVRALIQEGLDKGEITDEYTISGHRDHMAGRTCPGDKVYKMLQIFRHDVALMLNRPEVGERRWSNALQEYVFLTHYVDDETWSYIRESELRMLGRRAGAAFSKFPKTPNRG